MTAYQPARAQVPWALSDARTEFFTTFGGLAALVMAWWGSSGTGKLDKQVTWMIVGVLALIVIGAGNFFWLLAGRRAVGVRRRALLDALDVAVATSTPGGGVGATGALYVTIPGTSRYHLASCLLVRDKALAPVGPAAGGDLAPCEMCQP